MVVILKRGEDKKNMPKLLEKLKRERKLKVLNARKYCGIIHLKKDALSIQKEMRNEWN